MKFKFIEIPFSVKGTSRRCFFSDWHIVFMDQSYLVPTREEVELARKVRNLTGSLDLFCTYEQLEKSFSDNNFLSGINEMEEVYISLRFFGNLSKKRVGIREINNIKNGKHKFLQNYTGSLSIQNISAIPIKHLEEPYYSYSLSINDSDMLIDYIHFNKDRFGNRIPDVDFYYWFLLFYVLKLYYEGYTTIH